MRERAARPSPKSDAAARVAISEKCANLPALGTCAELAKPLLDALLQHPSARAFSQGGVPPEVVDALVRLGAGTPSDYNLQPWRFVVVKDSTRRQRLAELTGDARLAQAPVAIVVLGIKEEHEDFAEAVFRQAAQWGAGSIEEAFARSRHALDELTTIPTKVWVERQSALVLAVMLLAVEALGLDAALVQCTEATPLFEELAIPRGAELVGVLAVGHAAEPNTRHPRRRPIGQLAFAEHYDAPWSCQESPQQAANVDIERND